MTAMQHLRKVTGMPDDLRYDPFGASMGTLWDIAHALEHAGEDMPWQWRYRDSMNCPGLEPHESGENDTAIMLTEMVAGGALTWSGLRDAGNVLDRYIGILTAQGRDY